MTPRERVQAALEVRQPDQVPHFEMQFQLCEEEFGPGVDYLSQERLDRATGAERERLLHENAQLFLRTAERFEWAAVPFWALGKGEDILSNMRLLKDEYLGDRYMLAGFAGGGTYGIPDGSNMMEYAASFFDRPREMHERAEGDLRHAIEWGKRQIEAGCELIILNTDYAFNDGPFLSPRMFAEFVTPYLQRNVAALRDAGGYVMLHTDGNLMPIMDQLLSAQPHALQSIDPQAGMDIAEVKRLYGDRLCLMGNVECGLLQLGTEEQIRQAARYCMQHGKPGGGYIFSTSNVVFKGMDLARYHLILDVWRHMREY